MVFPGIYGVVFKVVAYWPKSKDLGAKFLQIYIITEYIKQLNMIK